MKEKQADLLTILATTTPIENVGADTIARFDYQKNWAFCEMLDRHIAGEEYLVAFEFHEDVLFLKPEQAPSHIDFCQVKTVQSHKAKTLASITGTGAKRSVLAKLLDNAKIAGDNASVRIILVCNGKFDFSSTTIRADELDEKSKKKLLARLAKEIPGFAEATLSRMHFFVTDVPVQGIDTFLQGKVLDLFKQRFGEEFELNIFSWMRLIQGEINRRSKFPSDSIASISDLVQHKCIGRTEIANSLDHAHRRHRRAIDIATISILLNSEGWPVPFIMRLAKAVPTAVADYSNPSNDECRALCREISAHLETYDLDSTKLSVILSETQQTLTNAKLVPSPYRDPSMIHALTLLVYDEKLQPTSVDPKSKDA